MERDRGLSLLRQAHVEGLLDCREARLLDRKWWRKVAWTLTHLERRDQQEIWKLQHDLHCGLLDYFTGDQAVDMHWDQAEALENLVAQGLMPWKKHGKPGFSRRKFRELVGLWDTVYGDHRDPEVAEKINWTAQQLLAQARTPKRSFRTQVGKPPGVKRAR